MSTYQEFCRLRDLHIPGVNAPKHTEADAFFMAAAQLAVPAGYKLVPLEPTPEIIAGAAVASWPTASRSDIALARLAAPIVLMQMDMAPGTTVEAVAGMLATMAPAYRAMLAAAPIPPAQAEPATAAPHVAEDKSPSTKDLQFLTDVVTAAGLLSHGKTDKKLARRISDHACKVRMAAPGALAWRVTAGGSAQGQEAADATKAIYWFDCLYKCAKLLELSDDTAIPSGVVDAVEKLVAVRMPPSAAILEQEDSPRYPATMTAAIADVLGLMNFRTGPIAHVYRAAGAEIRTKCEDEQAFVLDRFLRLALEHGDDWRTAAEADLKAAHTLAEASEAVRS